jgi:hypothetical protein
VVVTISLGISASTAIFAVTNAVLPRPLPYSDSSRLVLVCGDLQKRNVKDNPLSNAQFFDLGSGAATMFEDFAAVNTAKIGLPREDGSIEEIRTARVTPNFFHLMMWVEDVAVQATVFRNPQPGADDPPGLDFDMIRLYVGWC